MLALVVSLQVKPGHRDAFLAAITEQAKRSFAEARLPVLRRRVDTTDDHHFVFYELYTDQSPSTPTALRRTSPPGGRRRLDAACPAARSTGHRGNCCTTGWRGRPAVTENWITTRAGAPVPARQD